MQFGKMRRGSHDTVVMVDRGLAVPLDMARNPAVKTLADLLHTPDPVKTAADQLGYRSASSLSRAFTQTVGRSPRTWVRQQT